MTTNAQQTYLQRLNALSFPDLTEQDWRTNISAGMNLENMDETEVSNYIGMMWNSFHFTKANVVAYVQQAAAILVEADDHIVGNITTLQTETGQDRALLHADNGLIASLTGSVSNLTTQLNQLPLGQQSHGGGGHSRQPKIGEPPEFSGSDQKVKFTEWFNKVSLWLVHEGLVTDRQRIAVAMTKLTGAAAQYMEPWIQKLTSGGTVGTWTEFVDELKVQYGQNDEKEGAKKELTALFANKDLAHKNFIKYAERYRTLGRISGYEDQLLMDKLEAVIEREMRLVLIGWQGSGANTLPTNWREFLNLLLNLYKQVHPEKAEGHIFSKGHADGTVPMDVDTMEKKKKGKKGKHGKSAEANSTEKKDKFCHICNTSGSHNTADCFYNAKNPNARANKDKAKKDGKKDGKEERPKKKIRGVQSESDSSDESSDEEVKTPKASSSKDSAKKIRTAYIEDWVSDDEQATPSPVSDKGKGNTKSSGGKDFLRRTM
jgi:hypothetical protein